MVLWWDQIGDGETVSFTSHGFWGAATEVIEHVGHGGSAEEKSLWAQLAARLHLNLSDFQLCWFAPLVSQVSIEAVNDWQAQAFVAGLEGHAAEAWWILDFDFCIKGSCDDGLVGYDGASRVVQVSEVWCICLDQFRHATSFSNLNPWWQNATCWQGRAKIEQAISDVYHQDSMYGALHFWGSWMPSKHFPFPIHRSVSTRM